MSSESPKRLLLFVHYNQRAELSDHVLYTLRSIRPLFEHVVFISNSPLNRPDLDQLADVTDRICVRENKGFDFGAWREAMDTMGWDTICKADSLTLMNDSCFGPLFELEPIFQQMQAEGIDFWGMTNHRPYWARIKKRYRRIPYHLQSYFLVFHQSVLRSNVFRSFWENVKCYDDIWDAILRLEITLTRRLKRKGFRCAAVVDTTAKDLTNPNWAHYHPEELVAAQLPFIKVKSILLHDPPPQLLECIREQSSYPVEFIESYCQPHR